MAERYFTPAEVAALVPELTTVMGELMERHAAAQEIKQSVERERQRLTLVGGGVPASTLRADAARLEGLTAEITRRLERITALGGVPKDLSLGLVDFPHVREGRVVNLCWKHGEREVGFWHGLDEGFASRRPL